MRITTEQLIIKHTKVTKDRINIIIFPRPKLDAENVEKTTISFDEDAIDFDVDIRKLIGIFNGEPTWRRLYLSGAYLGNPDENKELYPYSFKRLERTVSNSEILDGFSISWDDIWTPGVPELKFITSDYTSGNCALTIKTLIRFEALKYLRQAICSEYGKNKKRKKH